MFFSCNLTSHILNRSQYISFRDINVKLKGKCNQNSPVMRKYCLDNYCCRLLLVDLAKAFDTVPHMRLLHKLNYYGIRGSTHKWISSWLSGRSQQVVLDSQASDPVPVLSDVPQGSVLGRILFLIFINDLPDNIRSSVCLFSDACVLYRNIYSIQDCFILQEDIASLGQWEADWQMKFNVAKCHSIYLSSITS